MRKRVFIKSAIVKRKDVIPMARKKQKRPGWYYIRCMHGPGHQSHSDLYEWLEDRPTPEEAIDNWFRHHTWPVIEKITKLKRLPKNVLTMKKEYYYAMIYHAKEMLGRLR